MTRINVIAPRRLTDQHLLAEYRELPRVFALAAKATSVVPVPPDYTLGTGHVRFFYARTGYLAQRQQTLIQELLDRGYNLTHRTAPAPVLGRDADWTPDDVAGNINLARLREKLAKVGAKYTYYGKPVGTLFYGLPGPEPHAVVDLY